MGRAQSCHAASLAGTDVDQGARRHILQTSLAGCREQARGPPSVRANIPLRGARGCRWVACVPHARPKAGALSGPVPPVEGLAGEGNPARVFMPPTGFVWTQPVGGRAHWWDLPWPQGSGVGRLQTDSTRRPTPPLGGSLRGRTCPACPQGPSRLPKATHWVP